MLNHFRKTIVLVCVSVSFLVACRKENKVFNEPLLASTTIKNQYGALRYDSYVEQVWYNMILGLIKETPGHTPPVAARDFGYVGIALYECLVGDMAHHSLVGQLQGLNSLPQRAFGNAYSAPIVANAALGRIVRLLFQNASIINITRIDSLESAINDLYSKNSSDVITDRSRIFGIEVSDGVFNWSKTDGGYEAYANNFPADYVASTGIDKWVPTPPLHQSAMLPYWGGNRTIIATNSPGVIDPPPPPLFSAISGSSFFNAAYEVYNASKQLNASQRTIALYWADGNSSFTPPGHNIAIALQIIRNKNLNLYEASVLLAKLGIAESDAAVVCWRAKFSSNLLRPISYIRSYIDANWIPLINTPPFPSYISGHSSFSGAAATILSAEIGNAVSFTDSSKITDGFKPRFFSNFYEAAQEAAISRLYGGIHYSFDNENGLKCGQDIAANVQKLKW